MSYGFQTRYLSLEQVENIPLDKTKQGGVLTKTQGRAMIVAHVCYIRHTRYNHQ